MSWSWNLSDSHIRLQNSGKISMIEGPLMKCVCRVTPDVIVLLLRRHIIPSAKSH